MQHEPAVERPFVLAVDGPSGAGKTCLAEQLRIGLDDQDDAGFALLTGHELVVDGMLLAGASGSVPGLGNVFVIGGDVTDPHGAETDAFKVLDVIDLEALHLEIGCGRGCIA